ncbi:MAG: glycosyltransferase [Weeksellaceae bacterium]|nr:glycosyltransferase [Weeksellaceae bacterium]
MLSILVPVYAYDVTALVQHLHHACTHADITFEIRIADDASKDPSLQHRNSQLQNLSHTTYTQRPQNVGNRLNRQSLAQEAQYDWLLFLDADTLPVSENFIELYVAEIRSNESDAICGGIAYKPSTDAATQNLRHLYGSRQESLTNAANTDVGEWKGSNFLIRKSVFQQIQTLQLPSIYGYVDVTYGITLKKNGFKTKFINNPVYHLGLESSKRFLEKTDLAMQNALFLYNNLPESRQYIKILKWFHATRPVIISQIFVTSFQLTSSLLKRNLLSNKPNIFLFQFYKLGKLHQLHNKQ